MAWRLSFERQRLQAAVRTPWVRRGALAALGVFVALTATLFFAGPPLIKAYLTETLARELNRKVSVGAVRVNPFELSATVENLLILEPDGTTRYLALRELYANLQLASLAFGGPVLREIRLVEPYVHLVRLEDGSYNVLQAPGPLLAPKPERRKEAARPLSFSLNNIHIVNGSIDFVDRPRNATHTVRELDVAIPFLSNLFYRVDDPVEPRFAAMVNGAPFRLTGSAKPFEEERESTLEIKLSGVALGEYLAYVPKKLHFTLPGGQLDVDAHIAFRQPAGQAPQVVIRGKAAVVDLALDEAKDVPTLRFKRLEADLGALEPLVQRYRVDRIALSDAELWARRDRHGRLNLAQLVEPEESTEPLPDFVLRQVSVDRLTLNLRDASLPHTLETRLTDIRIDARDLASAPGTKGHVRLSANGPGAATLQAAAGLALQPLKVSELEIALAKLDVPNVGTKGKFLQLGGLRLSGGAIDFEARSVALEEVALRDTQLNLLRDANGSLNLLALLPKADAAQEAPVPWQYRVGRVTLDAVALDWRDEVPKQPVDFGLRAIAARIDNVSSVPGSTSTLAFSARGSRGGSIGADGTVVLQPALAARLDAKVADLPFLSLQPYLADRVDAILTGGTLSARGRLEVKLATTPDIRYSGNAQINRFASVDTLHRDDLLKWETLHVGDIKLATAPFTLAIGEVALSNFYSRLISHPDGTLNLQQVLQTRNKALAEKPAAAGETQAAAPITIARVSLSGGQVNFTDNFIRPNYSANLTQIGGSVSGLSSALDTTADLELRGKVDDSAPVEIVGKINPLSGNLFLDIAASAKGVDLPPATPYAARYAGYPILKGKLSMDVKYRIENRALSAQNRIVLDQLTFGDRVESPDATKLPVLLAVALLKDRNGVIDINLPISGSLDDPEFSVGGIVIKVIVNLLVKAVTSPFALLGSLFGGGEELSYIEFAPGRAALDPAANDKIATLAKALEDRPGLKLDITGRADPARDRDGLRRVSMERRVAQVKFDALARAGNAPASLDEVKVDAAEYPRLLKEAYGREKFPKPRNVIGLAKDLPVAEMEQLMLTHAAVSEDDLRQLAIRRARSVADALARTGKVAAERVFVLEPRLGGDADPKPGLDKAALSRVEFSLK